MNELNIVSYNIWFDPVLELQRTCSLIATIFSNDADVICLQEVRPHIYKILISQLKKYKYHYPKKINQGYGCAILSRYPISKCLKKEFENSLMGRSLIIAQVDYPCHSQTDEGISVDNKEIIVATTHFESIFSRDKENTVKIEQYKKTEEILNNLYEKYRNVILCADLNILDHEEDKFIPTDDSNWSDAWKLKGNESNKFTFDSYTNIYLQMKKYKYRSRLDRVIFNTDDCVLNEYRRIEGVEGSTQPSDHYGVVGKFGVS